MKPLDIALETAEDALVQLAEHVPADMPIGRPLTALNAGDGGTVLITTRASFWWSYPDRAYRMDQLVDGRVELVEWRAAVEVSRTVDTVQ